MKLTRPAAVDGVEGDRKGTTEEGRKEGREGGKEEGKTQEGVAPHRAEFLLARDSSGRGSARANFFSRESV